MSRSILVVDDELKIAEILEKFLTKQGFAVTRVLDAGKAIDELGKGAFDLLITDLRMPGLTGIDVLKARSSLHPELPVIVLTGSIDAEESVASGALKEVGCTTDDICYKPVDLFALREMVNRKIGAL